MSMLKEYDNASNNFWLHVDEESILKKQNLKKDNRDLVDKSLEVRSCAKDSLSGHTSQDELFACELLLFLIEVVFSKQEFLTYKPILDIKYYYADF